MIALGCRCRRLSINRYGYAPHSTSRAYEVRRYRAFSSIRKYVPPLTERTTSFKTGGDWTANVQMLASDGDRVTTEHGPLPPSLVGLVVLACWAGLQFNDMPL
jgi:hypothetical protein